MYFNIRDHKERRLNDKNIYPASKIYQVLCSCKENYIAESKGTIATWQGKQKNSIPWFWACKTFKEKHRRKLQLYILDNWF